MKQGRRELGILVALVVLALASALVNPNILKPENLQNTSRLIGIYGIFSLGMALVIVTSGIDLSVGSLFAMLGVLLSQALLEWHWPPVLAFVGVLALGALLGYSHGLLVTKVKLQPFIVTLCGLLVYRGMARFFSGDETKGFGTSQGFEWMKFLGVGSVGPVPTPLVLLAVVFAGVYFLMHRTVYGRHLFAVGRNEEAARYAGVNANFTTTMAYVLCGLLGGLTTVLFAFYTNSISPSTHGNFYELYAIAAAVLGGCSLRGGEGSAIGVVLGTALLQMLRNLVNLLHIPSSLELAVMGFVILAGVLLDTALAKAKRPNAVAAQAS